LFRWNAEIVLFDLSVLEEVAQAAIISLFTLLGEKTGRKLAIRAVICHAFAALAVPGTGIGAGTGCGIDTVAHMTFPPNEAF
jgi:hypothetical protein